jgi:outer membrane murein-binding lipoprotein Lpp
MSPFFCLFSGHRYPGFCVVLFEWAGIASQVATDKTSLKAQLDDLAAEKTELASKVDALTEEVAQLKAESSKEKSSPISVGWKLSPKNKLYTNASNPPSKHCVVSLRHTNL